MTTRSRRPPLLPIILSILGGTILSCQQDVPTKPQENNGPFVVSQTSIIDSSRMPDSVSWTHKGKSGTFSLTINGQQSFQIKDSFPQSLASDTLVISLWTLGLRTTVVPSIVKSNGGFTPIASKHAVDSSAVKLLQSFDSLRNLDHASFGYVTDPVPSQILSLQKAIAVLVYSRKLSLAALPPGVDSGEVLTRVILIAARSGSRIDEVALITALDIESLREITESLFQNGELNFSDSAFLTPNYPLRLLAPLSVASPLIAGGSAVSVRGAFGWSKGAKISSHIQLYSSQGEISGFAFQTKGPISQSDTVWTLTDNATLQAHATAEAGIDTLVVSISDDLGHIATARTVFRVVKADSTLPQARVNDTAAPQITSMGGTHDTDFVWSIRTYELSWSVTDDSALASVTLNGSDLPGTDGVFRKSVSLSVGRDSFLLVAKDHHGRESKSLVVITRNADTTAPVVSLKSPPKDAAVPNAVDKMDVEANASDLNGIDAVLINGVKVTVEPFQISVPLAVGPNVVSIKAWDKAGNESKSLSVTITRAKSLGDTVAPQIDRVTPNAKDTTVGYLITSIPLSYLITDDSLSAVTLNGKVLTSTASLYQTSVDLPVGTTSFVLVALDKKGNPARDTVSITRLKDTTRPVVSLVDPTKDTTVWAFVPSVTVTWKVTDNALKLVSINGATATKVGDLFSQKVNLATDTTWIRLMALDSSGNTDNDSIRVLRQYDHVAPTILLHNVKSRLVAYGVAKDTLRWNVRENLKLLSVTLNGKALTSSDTLYTAFVSLAVGTNRFVLVAADSAGNKTTDTAIVARTAPTPTHSAAPGRYIGAVYDTITSVGADSIMYSTDGASWKKLTKPLSITTSGTIYAKAMPGEGVASAAYTLSQIKKVVSGGSSYLSSSHSLFLMTDGSVWESGLVTKKVSPFIRSISKSQLTGVEDVEVYNAHGDTKRFFKMSDNSWYAEGWNYSGSLGIGAVLDNGFVQLSDVVQVAPGNGESYFLLKDGTVWGAGSLMVKILGPYPTPEGDPVQITLESGIPLKEIVKIKAGFPSGTFVPNTVALGANGDLWGWGWGDSTPSVILSGVKSMALSSNLLVLMTDGTVQGLGMNGDGQIGNGFARETGVMFSKAAGLSDIIDLSTSGFHSLFLRKDGVLYLSGLIETAMTGTGQPTGPITHTPIELAREVKFISSGFDGSFFVKSDGTLWSIGLPADGLEESGVNGAPRRVDF
ncbi:MAG: hypothetical protein H6686_02840 [Fibrobacteria bacterium]|nr:hypothetical protein [Fibrobacteria bacterium]